VDWIALTVAGVLEWGWPMGLKLGQTERGKQWGWIGFAAVCMAASGALLLYAQRTIAIGTAYAVWTGIGAVGTFLIGILVFRESAKAARFLSVGLIVVGIVGLKFVS